MSVARRFSRMALNDGEGTLKSRKVPALSCLPRWILLEISIFHLNGAGKGRTVAGSISSFAYC
jgi:hypothetical protein